MQRGNHAVGDDACAEPSRRARRDAAVEDQLHLTGPADIEILADDFLEKNPSGDWTVQHLSQ